MAINEDELKAALKDGLHSMKASDELRSRTLELCLNELEKEKTKARIFGISRNRFVIGSLASAAACALVVSLFYISFPLKDLAMKSSMPGNQAAAAGESQEGKETGRIVAFDNGSDAHKEEYSGDTADAAPSPAPTAADSPEASAFYSEEPPHTGSSGKSAEPSESDADRIIITFSEQANSAALNSLGSSVLAVPGFNGANSGNAKEAAESILKRYNTEKSVAYAINDNEVFTVYGTVSDKVTVKGLEGVNSYKELVDDSGYYATPLYDSNGNLSALLSYSLMPELTDDTVRVSVRGTTATDTEGRTWIYMDNTLVSEKPEGMNLLYNVTEAKSAIKEISGSQAVSTPVVLDIRYGMDYILFATSGGAEYGIPYVSDEERYDLTNGKVYDFKNLVEHLLKGLSAK